MATQSTGNRTGQQQSEQPTQSQQGGTNGQQQNSGSGDRCRSSIAGRIKNVEKYWRRSNAASGKLRSENGMKA